MSKQINWAKLLKVLITVLTVVAAPLLKDRKSAMGIHRTLPLHLPLCLLARLRRISAFILADAEWCWPVM